MKGCMRIMALAGMMALHSSFFISRSHAQYNVNRLLTSGRIALHYEDYVLSIQYFNQAISQKPYLWEPWELRATAKYFLDDWQGAADDATQAIKLNPYITNLYDLRGITYIRQKDYDKAISDYSKAIALNPSNKGYWANRAACYIEKKSYDSAQHELDTIISRWNNYATAYLMKAEVYLMQNDTANAIKWLDNTLKIESYNAEAWRTKGHIALQQEQWHTADSCLTRALHYKPKNVGCYINRALARLRLNNLRGAMADYDTALEHDPNNFLAHYNRGILRQQVGDDNRAIEDFNYVLSLEPGNIMALFNRATLLDRTGDLRGAIRDYSIVIRQFPNFWTGLHYRAACYRRLGMTAKAEQDEFRILKAQMNKHMGIQNRWSKSKLNAMRKLSDIDPEKYNQIVVDDEEQKQHEYDSAYRGKVQNRNTADVFQPYLALTMSRNQHDNVSNYIPYEQHASSQLDKIYGMTGKNELLSMRLGNVSEANGTETFAATDSLTSMILHSRNADEAATYTLMRSIAYSSSLNYQDAINDLNSVLARDPDNFVALWQITVCKALMAEYEKHTTSHDAELRHRDIMENFRRLMQMSPNNPIILYCYGTYDARNEHYDEAIKLFSKAIELSPQMPYAYYNRGLAYMKAGKPVEARKDFSKSGELGLFGAYNLLKK